MYKIICDRCGEEYALSREVYELDRGVYCINRYIDGVDPEFGEKKRQSYCLCPKCEANLDVWLGFREAPSSLDMLRDESFGLPRLKEDR